MHEEQLLSRKIIISEPITDDLARDVIFQIMSINDYDSKMSVVKTYEPEPIEMFINSGGGSATAGNAIIGAMEMSYTPIITYGLGTVASMALAIFASGDYRIANRMARFMYHAVSYGMDGHIVDHKSMHREAVILQNMYNRIFAERTNLSKEKMSAIINSKEDYFFSADKALEHGIADEVTQKPEVRIQIIENSEVEQ